LAKRSSPGALYLDPRDLKSACNVRNKRWRQFCLIRRRFVILR